MEIDSRRLYLGEGCASMFGYCTRVLHLAEGAAYNRIEAARAARSYPMILELFEQSAITLTAVRLLAPHLTAANHAAVLTSARHKSKREIEELAASLKPKPDAPMVVRKLPARSTTLAAPLSLRPDTALEDSAAAASPSTGQPRCEVVLQPTITPLPPARIAPLAPERYRIQLTVSRETHDKFRRAQALLRHAVPWATLPRSSIARSRSWSTGWSINASPKSPARAHARRAQRARVTFRLPCGGQYGGVMTGAARSPAPKGDAARRRFSSFTISNRTPREERRAWRTSSCAVARATCMRRGCSSGRMLFAKRVPARGDSFQNESAGPSVSCGSPGTGTAAGGARRGSRRYWKYSQGHRFIIR
jgi:hypothetical protein